MSGWPVGPLSSTAVNIGLGATADSSFFAAENFESVIIIINESKIKQAINSIKFFFFHKAQLSFFAIIIRVIIDFNIQNICDDKKCHTQKNKIKIQDIKYAEKNKDNTNGKSNKK